MRFSQLFIRTSRQAPKDEVGVNAQLLARAGFIYKNSAGVFSFLPLGWRVIQKIAQIIREEMNAIGGQEMLMPALVEKKYWEKSGRWETDVGYRVKGRGDREENFTLGWTHEEVISDIVSHYIQSEKDLPLAVYQIQTKFRNEPRARSGLIRTREFIMKDLYSFHASQKDFEEYYGKVKKAYQNTFERLGLPTVYTLAAGGAFTGSHTHEFQVISEAGEDTIAICEKCQYAENKEITKLKDGGSCPQCPGRIKMVRAIEVGNVFPLGTKYSDAFKLKGRPVMGSYGIGLGRAMGAIVEVHHDKQGIIWPEAAAPFQAHLLEFPGGSGAKTYEHLQQTGIEVLYDDRDVSAGEKLMDADLLGIPWRLVVSEKTGDKLEVKKRDSRKAELMGIDDLIKKLKYS